MAELADVDPESKNLVPNVLILSEIITTHVYINYYYIVGRGTFMVLNYE